MTQFEGTLPAGVSLADHEGLPVVQVRTDAASADIALQGAQVLSWRPAGADEVLWLSPHAVFEPGTAVRGGVPLCAPWFGPGRKKDKPSAHGWFRTASWTLADAAVEGDDVVLRFTLSGADADVPEGEATDISAEYLVRVGRELGLSLTVTAGAEGLDLEEALHTYLSVSDVAGIRIEGLGGTRYADKAPGGRAVNAQPGDLTLTRQTDRVYGHDGQAIVVDEAAGRRIVVDKEGSGSTVIWNPWEAKAAEAPDIGDAWRGFVCVEAANALNQHVQLDPGAAHTITTRLSLQ
ncbi:glucose-6-phosphate 1-epimerase [Kineosphaera limosa]|uniref:Putative glucose-6-phosphate 1-epimerase n=1 Tax=Kineosphaera limosa NBRC 100340 TaxID=1184609 RepID=K6WE12_9MICO|nr:D-hexose-6-phosphate mutarotase [Kineosphaera limosa]NYE00611.1 glucose-6-phosphate 1-epimerase [Kineosphaera limosa]GAB97535.1 hypothetical protein KILIM_073_00150 [Kineosphaera limosa NBRC 100340]